LIGLVFEVSLANILDNQDRLITVVGSSHPTSKKKQGISRAKASRKHVVGNAHLLILCGMDDEGGLYRP